VSCGSRCTGSGPADGFQCALGSPGIPAACSRSFGYTPANLTASLLTALAPVAPVDLSCAGTVTFDGTNWGGATCGQTLPVPFKMPQAGGPNLAVLAFQSLSIASGVTLSLSGQDAIAIVVFGDATVAGAVHADGSAGAPQTINAGAPGPGGGNGCNASTGGSGNAGHTGGGGGGGGPAPARAAGTPAAPAARAASAARRAARSRRQVRAPCAAGVPAARAGAGRARPPAGEAVARSRFRSRACLRFPAP
jgi:hypothetical protein